MAFASLLQYAAQPLRVSMLEAVRTDIRQVAEAMAGASDMRIIGTLQGRYALLKELETQLTKP